MSSVVIELVELLRRFYLMKNQIKGNTLQLSSRQENCNFLKRIDLVKIWKILM